MTVATRYPAPAKLNLFLHVVGQRADGYHEIQTVFRFLDACDELTILPRNDRIIRRTNTIEGLDADNDLCIRAARLLRDRTGCDRGADITLDKRLPMGGGLGGGSSDAATVLIVLNRLWGTNLERASLAKIALELGADVPVFVCGQSAFAEGIGERLIAIDLPPAWYVVLVPPVTVPTATIFRDSELTRNTNRIKIPAFFAGGVRNDLEPVVCRLFPEVRDHLEWLRRFGPARITGSGACVYAAFDQEERAREVLAASAPKMRGFVAQGLDHHPLHELILGSRQAG